MVLIISGTGEPIIIIIIRGKGVRTIAEGHKLLLRGGEQITMGKE